MVMVVRLKEEKFQVWYTKASFRGTEVAGLDSFIGALNRGSYSSNQMMQGWAALKQGIQNEVRTLNFVSDIFQDLKTLGHHCVRRYIALLKLILPRDGHGRTFHWN
ncbi:hypothetical protein ACB094_06G040300 [Castanea mollissima]